MKKEIAFAFLCTTAAAGCADDGGKGAEEAPFTDIDKADSFRSPTAQGQIVFGPRQSAQLTSNARFHAWRFDLSDDATVTLATDLGTPNLDTVMYMYRRDPGTDRWGRFKFKNDDHDGSLASRLSKNLGSGEYRVIIKAFKTSMTGTYGLTGTCEGDGCPGADAPPCDPDVFAAIPGDMGEACGPALSDAMNSNGVRGGGVVTSLDDRCVLPTEPRLAVEYYHAYWSDVADFDDMFDFGGGVDIEVTWDVYDNGSVLAQIDAGGDEAAMDFLFNSEGQLVAHYQHNQSPDYTLYCGGHSIFRDDEECGSIYMDAMLRDDDPMVSDEVIITAAEVDSELEGAAREAARAYVAEFGLEGDDFTEMRVEFTMWENPFASSGWDTAANVTVEAAGDPIKNYEVASASTTQWVFAAGEEGEDLQYICEEL